MLSLSYPILLCYSVTCPSVLHPHPYNSFFVWLTSLSLLFRFPLPLLLPLSLLLLLLLLPRFPSTTAREWEFLSDLDWPGVVAAIWMTRLEARDSISLGWLHCRMDRPWPNTAPLPQLNTFPVPIIYIRYVFQYKYKVIGYLYLIG